MRLQNCVLTGESLMPPPMLEGEYITYSTPITGKVIIATDLALEYQSSHKTYNPTLAALCRRAHDTNVNPPVIDLDFINNKMNALMYPKVFMEKAMYFLRWLYDHGAKNFVPRSFDADSDCVIAFAEDGEEFHRIMAYLSEDKYWIKWRSRTKAYGGQGEYNHVLLTDGGMEEVQKNLPKIPMIGLVDQAITTGDSKIDEKINHAKRLFFEQEDNMENMRSACIALAAVLEPIRYELTPMITDAAVNDLFLLVNKFDIRHNKNVSNLKYPEQLEWVFYSLLNTINTYTKLKNRLK